MTASNFTRILLVGVGKMGGALLKGWSTHPNLVISTLDPHYDGADYTAVADIPSAFDVILLAVKPQVMADVAQSLRPIVTPDTLILSIAAGKTLGFLENIFGASHPIIRAMPNTPALIGKGISVLCGNRACTDGQRQIAQMAMNLLCAVGDAEWVDDESLMDAVTALSGSGPAYLFHLIESMTAAGVTAGLSPALSEKLARQTVIGAAALADNQSSISAATLRQNVTSPGGTTAAALTILMAPDTGLTPLLTTAILAARERSAELG